jgi:hypothetical protein
MADTKWYDQALRASKKRLISGSVAWPGSLGTLPERDRHDGGMHICREFDSGQSGKEPSFSLICKGLEDNHRGLARGVRCAV